MKSALSETSRNRSFQGVLILAATLILTATASYASGGGGGHEGEGRNWIDFGWRMLNFAILLWFLWWLLAQKLRDFFTGRREGIKTSLEEAAAAKAEAEKKFAEYSAKLEKATEEIDSISEMIKAQGLAEKEKIIEDAKRTAEKMKEDTQARIDQEVKKARNDLRAEAVQLSVQMAEEIIRKNMTSEDHNKMVAEYLDKVVIKH
ncbi:MAG: F0F1 ATP synthase subunit B [Deltaproteobacteria bacterium]|nr:F0F1 ATP synthase subunit B [Deltaproteobacteria bacterium]